MAKWPHQRKSHKIRLVSAPCPSPYRFRPRSCGNRAGIALTDGGVGVMAQNHLSRCQLRCQTITRSLEMSAHNSDFISIACHCRGAVHNYSCGSLTTNRERRTNKQQRMHSQGNAALACFLKKDKGCAYFCRVSKCPKACAAQCASCASRGSASHARASCVQRFCGPPARPGCGSRWVGLQ